MIPGGGLEDDESENECCIREVAEETGMLIKFQIAYWKSMSTINIGNGLISIFLGGGEVIGTTEMKLTEREKRLEYGQDGFL